MTNVTQSSSSLAALDFWQVLYEPGHFAGGPDVRYEGVYPACLPDGRQIALPPRPLPGASGEGVASLILNQTSFVVEEACTAALAGILRPYQPDIVVAVPTLGLIAGRGAARALGHARYVALGTSRKFWYEDALSVPLSSITSPTHGKRLWIDPRLLPLLDGRRVALVDDVISTGSSMIAAVTLLERIGIVPVCLGAIMLQTKRWRERLAAIDVEWPRRTVGVFETPLLRRRDDGGWNEDSTG